MSSSDGAAALAWTGEAEGGGLVQPGEETASSRYRGAARTSSSTGRRDRSRAQSEGKAQASPTRGCDTEEQVWVRIRATWSEPTADPALSQSWDKRLPEVPSHLNYSRT